METRWSDIRPLTTYAPERFTSRVYQTWCPGKPRMSGARAALDYFEVPDAADRVEAYAERKQEMVVELIEAGEFTAFPDALRFVLAVREPGAPDRGGVVLEERRADARADPARHVRRRAGPRLRLRKAGLRLLDLFDVDISGRDFARGKPDPEIFLTAAAELALPPHQCFVVEDAVAGIEAAKAGGMAALGVARADDVELLSAAQADLVVTSVDAAPRGAGGGGPGGAPSPARGGGRPARRRGGGPRPAGGGAARPPGGGGPLPPPVSRGLPDPWQIRTTARVEPGGSRGATSFPSPVRVVFEVPQEVLYRADHGHHLLPVEPFTQGWYAHRWGAARSVGFSTIAGRGGLTSASRGTDRSAAANRRLGALRRRQDAAGAGTRGEGDDPRRAHGRAGVHGRRAGRPSAGDGRAGRGGARRRARDRGERGGRAPSSASCSRPRRAGADWPGSCPTGSAAT